MRPPKDFSEFKGSLSDLEPSDNWPEELKALWHDAKGDWHSAHEIVDGMDGATAEWIHAYLHRKEGDKWNAGYWYRRAGRPFSKISLEEEHKEIVDSILSR